VVQLRTLPRNATDVAKQLSKVGLRQVENGDNGDCLPLSLLKATDPQVVTLYKITEKNARTKLANFASLHSDVLLKRLSKDSKTSATTLKSTLDLFRKGFLTHSSFLLPAQPLLISRSIPI